MPHQIVTLTADDVLRIHEFLAEDFARTKTPISPAGLADRGLLESAVSRQTTANGTTLKYPTPIENAATLAYGVCCNHAFHNGNKRTALVAMLVHLDKNRFCLYNTVRNDLYELMISIAAHTIGVRVDPRRKGRPEPRRPNPDDEIRLLAEWIRKRAEKVVKGEHPITFHRLKQILTRFGFETIVGRANSLDIVRIDPIAKDILGRPKKKRVLSIGYHNEGSEVPLKDIKLLRRECHLQPGDRVDSNAFYEDADIIDDFVNKYRKVLDRLAKK